MDISNCLPYFFAVSWEHGYKIFRNTIGIVSSPINIIWPESIYELGKISKIAVDKSERSIFIRKWSNEIPISCMWNYQPFQIEMIINDQNINIPVINISTTDLSVLPEKSPILFTKGFNEGPASVEPFWPAQVYR
jgi:hypothetical protein